MLQLVLGKFGHKINQLLERMLAFGKKKHRTCELWDHIVDCPFVRLFEIFQRVHEKINSYTNPYALPTVFSIIEALL